VLAATLSLAGSAAAAPLPTTATAYTSHGYKQGVSVTLVTSATNPRRIQAGAAPLGTEFATGGIYARCPKAPKAGKAPFAPFAGLRFPALTLTLSHGHYGFSRTLHDTVSIFASSLSNVKLTVLFSGTVISPSLIQLTVRISGKGCANSAKVPVKAAPGEKVAPGQ
jgi:hypothetical protein